MTDFIHHCLKCHLRSLWYNFHVDVKFWCLTRNLFSKQNLNFEFPRSTVNFFSVLYHTLFLELPWKQSYLCSAQFKIWILEIIFLRFRTCSHLHCNLHRNLNCFSTARTLSLKNSDTLVSRHCKPVWFDFMNNEQKVISSSHWFSMPKVSTKGKQKHCYNVFTGLRNSATRNPTVLYNWQSN